MRRLVLVPIVVAALAASSSAASTAQPVNALVWQKNTLSLAALDATTLAQRGRLLPLGRAQGSVSTDHLGDRLAVASAGVGVAIVDVRRMRLLWRLPRGQLVRGISWLSPTRLLVVEHGSVLLLDPVRKRVVARSDFVDTVLGSAKWSGGLVFLAYRNEGSIEPARLVVVGPGVAVRKVELSRIAAGWASGPTTTGGDNMAQPALAVDAAAGRAYVTGGPYLATVDLASLAVSYSGAERTLEKWTTGPRRSAAWLGDGVLAIAGSDEKWTGAAATSTPFGLRLVTPGRVRLVDKATTDVRDAGDLVLAFGQRYTDGRSEGIGLTAYDRAGVRRWHLLGDTPVTRVSVAGGRAYVPTADRVQVVDLSTGTLLAAVKLPWRSYLVLG